MEERIEEIEELEERIEEIEELYTMTEVVNMLASMTGQKPKPKPSPVASSAAHEAKLSLRKEAKRRIDMLRKRVTARKTEYDLCKERLQEKVIVLNVAASSGNENAKWLLKVIEHVLRLPPSKCKEAVSTISYISSLLQANAAHEEAVRELDVSRKDKAKI
jgi:methylphosphotriester-DNA--protein-cysteine methyltransferase